MPKLHTKYYLFVRDDVHHRVESRDGNPEGGLLCQDCHSTTSVHGNGNITGTPLANVEIECADCHVKIDYSKGKTSTDWVASGNKRFPDGHTAESKRDGSAVKAPGKASEARGYLRWEDPVLGINGVGRVTPIIPGCQQITTVIGPDGNTPDLNKIWRTPADLEKGGPTGQRGIDMAPAAPHTRSRQTRTWVSCHASSKALGCGTHDGRYLKVYGKGICVDVTNVKGEVISNSATNRYISKNEPVDQEDEDGVESQPVSIIKLLSQHTTGICALKPVR